MKARDYKMEFGLDLKFPLIDDEIKRKKQEAYAEDRDKYLANLSTPKAKKCRFKTGHAPKRTYFSEQSLRRTYQNLKKMNH